MTHIFVAPNGVPYVSTGKPLQRAFVKHYEDGAKGVMYEEAETPEGPWVECRLATPDDLDTLEVR